MYTLDSTQWETHFCPWSCSQEEVAGYQLLDPEDQPTFIPTSYNSLREVRAVRPCQLCG